MNFSNMRQIMEMRSEIKKAQKELSKITVEAEAGKGMVKVIANGQMEILSVKIDPKAIDPQRPDKLEKLIQQAVSEVIKKAQKEASKHLGELTQGLNIPGLT
jgi:hypothetical protein